MTGEAFEQFECESRPSQAPGWLGSASPSGQDASEYDPTQKRNAKGMEPHYQSSPCALPHPGPNGALGGKWPPGTVLVQTSQVPVRELSQLPSIWPRNELVAQNVGAIQNHLRSGGEIQLPVVVRCEPSLEGVVVDLVAGEHRIEAALREGCAELPVQVLIASRSEALLAASTPRTPFELTCTPLSTRSSAMHCAPWDGCSRQWPRMASSICSLTRFGCGPAEPSRRSIRPSQHSRV